MITISLLDFFRTGRFGPVAPGMSRKEVVDLLGEPDTFGYPPTNHLQAGVWKYGDIELHFGEDQPCLSLIWCDHIPLPENESRNVILDPWLFADGCRPGKEDIERGLQKAGILFDYVELEEELPAHLSLFSTEDEEDGAEPVEREPRVYYQEAEPTGMFVLESGVQIGIGRLVGHYDKGDLPPMIQEDMVVSIGFQEFET